MSNQTTVTEFLLLVFSDVPELQILHVVMFLVIYLATLIGNLLIITAVALDPHLHTPMYFFLINMSILDLGSISVLVTKSTANSLLNTKSISYAGCIAQVFLFVFFAAANITLLTVMAYDRYITICQPLDYDRVMNRDACVQMAASAWITAIVYSALHTGNIFRLPFYQLNVINQFFCEIPQLLKLACSDSHLSEVGILVFSACLILSCFASYVHIFMIVLRILSEQGQGKVFFTCLPHLTVISLLFCTGIFAHLKPTSSSASRMDLVMAVLYSVVPPTMNPVIYSLTKKEIKAALRRLNVWTLFTKNNIFVFLS